MNTVKYIYWLEEGTWLGYLQDWPDYWTQGTSFNDLIDHLKDLHEELSGGRVPGARKVGEFTIS